MVDTSHRDEFHIADIRGAGQPLHGVQRLHLQAVRGHLFAASHGAANHMLLPRGQSVASSEQDHIRRLDHQHAVSGHHDGGRRCWIDDRQHLQPEQFRHRQAGAVLYSGRFLHVDLGTLPRHAGSRGLASSTERCRDSMKCILAMLSCP